LKLSFVVEDASSTTPNQVELSQHAFELKLANQATQHPNSGRLASEGMQKKKQAPMKVGITRKEVGRVSQAGKVARARKDAKR
jgi:hypothetical protein